MEELLYFLNSVYPLSEGLKEHLLMITKSRTLGKKDYLLKAGQTSQQITFIKSGLLRAYYIKNETEVSSWFMKEGDIVVSIDSFYNQRPSIENIQAIEDCDLLYIEYNELEYIYKTFLEFNYVGRVLTIKYLNIWSAQLFSIRNQTAQERYEWLMANRPEVILRVPAKYIASYLDITEVTLSRIKNTIAKKRA